jgi:hypothetical protein
VVLGWGGGKGTAETRGVGARHGEGGARRRARAFGLTCEAANGVEERAALKGTYRGWWDG